MCELVSYKKVNLVVAENVDFLLSGFELVKKSVPARIKVVSGVLGNSVNCTDGDVFSGMIVLERERSMIY